MEKKLQEIASHFALEGGIAAIDSLGEGFINDTFIIRTEGEAPDYILQRKNKNIFPDVPAMMDTSAGLPTTSAAESSRQAAIPGAK